MSCSEQQFVDIDLKCPESARQSLSHFADHLKDSLGAPPGIRLQSLPDTYHLRQRLFLKYLIGATAVLGHVAEGALGAICRLHNFVERDHLLELMNALAKRNSFETVVQFVADSIQHSGDDTLSELVAELVNKDWGTMKTLAMGVMDIFKSDTSRCKEYRFMLRCLPIEQQYEMICTGAISLHVLHRFYAIHQFDLLLREILAMARCSSNQRPDVREYIANVSYLNQFLPDSTIKGIVHPCPDNIPQLHSDVWCRIFVFMDAETLTFVLPLVCTHWRDLYPRIMSSSTRIHDLYLWDFYEIKPSKIHTVAPWKYYLWSEASALKYLGHCIADGALSRTGAREPLHGAVEWYFKAVMSGSVPLPRFKGCIAPYDSFLRLFETVHEFHDLRTPSLDKPALLTEEEYERAIRYFVCEKGWTLQLPESLVADDTPRLFRIIGEDEELMKKLINSNFYGFERPSIMLILHGQARGLSEKLARLVLSQASPFKRLIEPKFIDPSDYYVFIARSGILPELLIQNHGVDALYRLLISLVLFFRDNRDTIDEIAASIVGQLSGLYDDVSEFAVCRFGTEISRLLEDAGSYSPEDANFVRTFMVKCGWTKPYET